MYRRAEESEVLMFWRYLLPPSSRQKRLFCLPKYMVSHARRQ
jgi:hypothetical protein